jgi:phytoene synthase
MTALYAFCREVDDVVDECSDPSVARMKLAWWRNEISGVYGGAPQHPVALALADVASGFHLQQEHLQAVIDGMEMDLDCSHYPDFGALRVYCHRVAGVVGLLSAEIFGYRDAHTLSYADRAGVQLLSSRRRRGPSRVYLPP